MQVEIKVDKLQNETKVIVVTNEVTDEVNQLVKMLSNDSPQIIAGFKDDCVEVLDESKIVRIFAESSKVYAEINNNQYEVKLRLYELENRLNKNTFVRISNSEIVNLKKVQSFDLSISGTICVKLLNGSVTYVSRRYVAKIKKSLGIWGVIMKKKIINRCLIGFPFGIAINMVILIIASVVYGDGGFSPAVPQLISNCNSEINAVILQTVLAGVYGSLWAGTTVIWEKDEWSILKQTVTHFAITSIATFPIAYIVHWMSHDVKGVLIYFGVFIVIYTIIWISFYLSYKSSINKMNKKINDNK